MSIKNKPHDFYVRVRLSELEFNRLEEMALEQKRTKSGVVRVALEELYNKKES